LAPKSSLLLAFSADDCKTASGVLPEGVRNFSLLIDIGAELYESWITRLLGLLERVSGAGEGASAFTETPFSGDG